MKRKGVDSQNKLILEFQHALRGIPLFRSKDEEQCTVIS